MRMLFLLAALAASPPAWAADAGGKSSIAVVPVRTIPVGAILRPDDVALRTMPDPPAADILKAVTAAIGQQAQRSLYANRPIRESEVGPVTVVERNSRVTLRFRLGQLKLTTVGRAMEAGGLGQTIRVMNLDSRRAVFGRITMPGVVDVGS